MQAQEIINNRLAQIAAAGVVGVGAGAAAGYFLGRRRENELQAVIDQYSDLVTESLALIEDMQGTITEFGTKGIGDYHLELPVTEIPDDVMVRNVDPELDELMTQAEVDDLVGIALEEVVEEDTDETGEDPEETSGEALNPIEAALAEVEADPTRLSLVEDTDEEDDTDLAIAAARGSHPAGTANVFDNPNGGEWNQSLEESNRSADAPYVLHQDEFYADERGWPQQTVTYFEGDQVLVDEQEKPIYNWGQVVGELKFGHGSNDANVVYVRNEKNEAEYEVLLFSGSYEEEVLGISQEPEDVTHSVGKFRASD